MKARGVVAVLDRHYAHLAIGATLDAHHAAGFLGDLLAEGTRLTLTDLRSEARGEVIGMGRRHAASRTTPPEPEHLPGAPADAVL